MPLKDPNPFADRPQRLRDHVNPYLGIMRTAAASGDLPLDFGPGLASLPGQWRQRLSAHYNLPVPPQRLILEIGCHKGQTLLSMAKAQPDAAFIGLDITFKRVVIAAQRAKAEGLKNIYCALANAMAIDKLFAPGELDGCIIFFPDPWSKKARQLKNRLVTAEFCKKLGQVLTPGGFCWFKTDQEPYFCEVNTLLPAAGFCQTDALPLAKDDFTSTFEQRFQAINLPTLASKWTLAAGDKPSVPLA